MIYVQQSPFDPAQFIIELHKDRHEIGAVASFLGLVRDFHSAEPGLDALELEHYPGMTEKMLGDIEAEACKRWDLQASLICHRYGRLSPGDYIVFVGCAAAHRQAAFESCHFIMDWLKTDAPFWKKEHFRDGRTQWVNAKQADLAAKDKW